MKIICAAGRWYRLTLIALAVSLAAVAAAGTGRTYVVWISVDGFRHDYIDRAETPVLDRLAGEGAFTRELVPTFPTLTFPSHASQATGVSPEKHGIPSNVFYDRPAGRTYRYPPFAGLLQAEPIWTTAQRQGVRTAVHDWPLSHWQRGPHSTDYFNSNFERGLSDEERLDRLLETWRGDRHEQPLRLLMGYGHALDASGHRYGPDAPEIDSALEELDGIMGRFLDGLLELFGERAGPEDELYLLLTTDHGMSPVHTAVNVELLTGTAERDDVLILTAGPLALVYLDEVTAAERRRVREELRGQASRRDFVRVYDMDGLPRSWGFRHDDRVGDLVLLLEPGYVFNRRAPEVTAPASEIGAVIGTHGYDAADNPDQLGFAIFWRYPHPLGGHDLGRVDALRLHATVAALLGIEPAPSAAPQTIDLNPDGRSPPR